MTAMSAPYHADEIDSIRAHYFFQEYLPLSIVKINLFLMGDVRFSGSTIQLHHVPMTEPALLIKNLASAFARAVNHPIVSNPSFFVNAVDLKMRLI